MDFEGNGAQILVECLHRAGITTLFGVPGDTGVALYDALYARGGAVRHVLARDERSAAMMADAYARVTNTVGVVEASSGGGTTYVLGGLGEPFAASVPILLITSDIHRASRGTGALTEIDQTLLFAAVTKWRATVSCAAEIPALLAQTLFAATSGRPAPVSLVLPEDVLEERAAVVIPEMSNTLTHARTPAPAATIQTAAEALGRAAWPAIVAGSGVHLSGAWPVLQRLAEEGGIPVATSIHGKGAIAEDSPWSLGVAGANGAREYANEYLAMADVVLFAGTRANSTDTNGYKSPPRLGPTIIGLDIEGERAGRNFPGSISLVGDAGRVLEQLRQALPSGDRARAQKLLAWIAGRRRAWDEATQAMLSSTSVPLHPAAVVRAIQSRLHDRAIIVADPGTPTPNVAAFWETAAGARSVIVPRGHGPMGYAIPGAIGAALAHPERPVIGLTADGSFAMSCGDLETAVRLQLPIIYVQFTNGSFGWIKMLQRLYFDRHYFGVDFGPVDAVAVARGFGLEATRVEDLEEFCRTLDCYLSAQRPAYIDIVVPDQTQLVPPVPPWHATLAGETGRPIY